MVGYPTTLKRSPSLCAPGLSPSMYTGMKWVERSMKSWRLKSVAFTWLQGGHHTAPQYRKSGLRSAFAWAKAASTSLTQAMPSPCPLPVLEGAPTLSGVRVEVPFGGTDDCEQAASASAVATRIGRKRKRVIDGAQPSVGRIRAYHRSLARRRDGSAAVRNRSALCRSFPRSARHACCSGL